MIILLISVVVTAARKVTDCFWQVANRVQRTVSAMTSGSIFCLHFQRDTLTDRTDLACQVAERESGKQTPAICNCSHRHKIEIKTLLLKVRGKDGLSMGIVLPGFSCLRDLHVL